MAEGPPGDGRAPCTRNHSMAAAEAGIPTDSPTRFEKKTFGVLFGHRRRLLLVDGVTRLGAGVPRRPAGGGRVAAAAQARAALSAPSPPLGRCHQLHHRRARSRARRVHGLLRGPRAVALPDRRGADARGGGRSLAARSAHDASAQARRPDARRRDEAGARVRPLGDHASHRGDRRPARGDVAPRAHRHLHDDHVVLPPARRAGAGALRGAHGAAAAAGDARADARVPRGRRRNAARHRRHRPRAGRARRHRLLGLRARQAAGVGRAVRGGVAVAGDRDRHRVRAGRDHLGGFGARRHRRGPARLLGRRSSRRFPITGCGRAS